MAFQHGILWLPEGQWIAPPSYYTTYSLEPKSESCWIWPSDITSESGPTRRQCQLLVKNTGLWEKHLFGPYGRSQSPGICDSTPYRISTTWTGFDPSGPKQSSPRRLRRQPFYIWQQIWCPDFKQWIPNPQQEAQAQEKIAALQAELSALKSHIRPGAPAHVDYVYTTWFRQLDMDGTTKTLIEKNILAIGKWWAAQPDEAKISASRMATCFGIPGGKTISEQNKYLLEILKVAVIFSSWLSTQLKTTTTMKRIIPALTLCKHQTSILASLSPLTLSSSINIFFTYRITQTRLMVLYVLHHPQCNDKLVAILRGTTCTRHLYGTTLLAHQQFSRSFYEPNTVYLRFTCLAKYQPMFYIGSTEDHTLGREHPRYRKFKQVNSGQFVWSELAIRFWSHSNNFFWWSPIPIYIRRANHWALEHALIQLWQPKLNFPFISQFFIPRKGIISKIPYSNTRQFGIASLWRKKRHKTTGKALRSVLCSPLFQNRVRMWTLLQDLGSNTRRRFEQTQYIRSTAFSLEGCYALRRLGIHLPETHQKMALQAIDSAIQFRKGKAVGKVRPFRAPWMLSRQLDSHIRKILRLWYFGIQHTAVPCHEPSFRLIYVKHPSLMEAICNHKEAIQNWSDDITPLCTCAVLKQFPSARAFPNLKGQHWVLDGALLAPLLPDRLAQIVGGSLNNKIFPNKKELQRLFVEAFHHWTKQNAIPCPDDQWILDQFAPILADHSRRITTHITAASTRQLQEQFTNCIFHNEDKRASSLRIYCPCQYFECIDKTFLDFAIFARSHESPNDSLQIAMQHLQNQFAQTYPWAMGRGTSLPAGYILPKGKKPYGSGRPIIQTDAYHLGKAFISIGPTCMSRPLCKRWRLPVTSPSSELRHCYGN